MKNESKFKMLENNFERNDIEKALVKALATHFMN